MRSVYEGVRGEVLLPGGRDEDAEGGPFRGDMAVLLLPTLD